MQQTQILPNLPSSNPTWKQCCSICGKILLYSYDEFCVVDYMCILSLLVAISALKVNQSNNRVLCHILYYLSW